MVVDDHEVVRRGLADIIEAVDSLTVAAEAGTAAEALRRALAVRPDVAVVDLRLPDGDGVTVVRRLAELSPHTRTVVLTSFDDEGALEAALAAGASAFLLKSIRGTEIAQAVAEVAAGRCLLDQSTLDRHRRSTDDPLAALTETERKILQLIGDGLSNREIGERLGVTEKTVKNHVTAVLAKMGFKRRTQAAAWVAARRSAGRFGAAEAPAGSEPVDRRPASARAVR